MANMTYDADDLYHVALVAWKESRGDGESAMRAVMHVVVNRVGSVGFPKTIHEVVYQKNAFSSMSLASDREYNLDPKQATGSDATAWTFCQNVVQSVLDGTDPDLTHGARYYADLKDATSGWFLNHIVLEPVAHPQVAQIGQQVFYL
jgi:N-acetylmuramoyl-L-alanine amidase